MTFRLLVADDSPTIQKIVTMAFEVEDMVVEGIGNGQQALERIPEFKPDLVLADVGMPGLDGFELSAKIKESPETSAIKVLLLSSDFEDFDEQRYQNCGADDHISKPFKSDDIVAMVKSLLVAGGPSGDKDPIEETIEPESNEEPSLEELLESVEKLSTEGGAFSSSDDEVLEEPTELPLAVEDETPELTAELPGEVSESPELMVDPVELPGEVSESPESLEDFAETELVGTDDDIMDQMILGVEQLRESVQPPPIPLENEDAEVVPEFSGEPEIFAEIRPHKMDDDLDSVFKEIVMGGRKDPAHPEKRDAELSSLGGIVPEPEDLLEHIAPGALSEVGRRPATPEDIKENLDYISGFADQDRVRDVAPLHHNLRSESWDYESGDDRFSQVVAEEVRQLLQRSLGSSLEKEVSGLSEAILRTVREVVREITPEIARRVIREEIEKIKKQDMY